MKVNMLNADTGEVEVREVDINNPESVTNFVVETEETDKLIDGIFGTVSDGIVGEG